MCQSKTITICLGSSCFARGNDANLPRLQDWLARRPDLAATLKGSRCEGRCQQGPNIRVDDAFLPEVKPDTLLDELERAL